MRLRDDYYTNSVTGLISVQILFVIFTHFYASIEITFNFNVWKKEL